MDILGYILVFTLLGSVVSLIGGVILVFKEQLAVKFSHYLASFAAGTLLGTAFLDLFPEALEAAGDGTNIFLWALGGLVIFFLLERFIDWFHHHHDHEKVTKSAIPLVLLGDSVHNFIDGVVIAAAFLVSIPTGILTSFAVAAHEIPQEIGDFGILIHAGVKRKKVILYNFLSALASIVGAVLMFNFGRLVEGILPIALSLTAGFFIYIAASDLIPEIHHQDKKSVAFFQTILLLLGILVIFLFVNLFG